jgi:hypothetical protein
MVHGDGTGRLKICRTNGSTRFFRVFRRRLGDPSRQAAMAALALGVVLGSASRDAGLHWPYQSGILRS